MIESICGVLSAFIIGCFITIDIVILIVFVLILIEKADGENDLEQFLKDKIKR